MKLYLSSYHIPAVQAFLELLPKPATECTVAIIPNAKDYKLPNERVESLDEWIVELGGWGFKSDVIDLRDYDDSATLRKKLETYPVVWVLGGNTFILRSEMKRTGLDEFLGELLEAGIVYCGESAGAIVAGKSLEGTELADEPDLADEQIVEGLQLVDKIIVPHADSIEYIEYVNAMKKRHPDDPNVVYINENQAFVVDGDNQKMVSAS